MKPNKGPRVTDLKKHLRAVNREIERQERIADRVSQEIAELECPIGPGDVVQLKPRGAWYYFVRVTGCNFPNGPKARWYVKIRSTRAGGRELRLWNTYDWKPVRVIRKRKRG